MPLCIGQISNKQVLDISASFKAEDLSKSTSYLPHYHVDTDFEDILFDSLHFVALPNSGVISSAHFWLKISLRNTSLDSLSGILFLGNLQHIRLFVEREGRFLGHPKSSGSLVRKSDQGIYPGLHVPNYGRSAQIALTLAPGKEHNLYIHCSQKIAHPVKPKPIFHSLSNWQELHQNFQLQRNFRQGLLQGITWVFILLSLSLWIFYKERVFGLFSLYVFLLSVVFASRSGILDVSVLAEHPLLSKILFDLSPAVAFGGFLLFFIKGEDRADRTFVILNYGNVILASTVVSMLGLGLLFAFFLGFEILLFLYILSFIILVFSVLYFTSLFRSDSKYVKIVARASLFMCGGAMISLVLSMVHMFGVEISLPFTVMFPSELGAAIQVIYIFTGMLRGKKLQEQGEQQLREYDNMRTRFFANISHEFRTPLSLILGPTQKLLESQLDIDTQKDLNIIHQNGHRLLSLINELLDLSKIESGNSKLAVIETEVVSFIRTLSMAFESLARIREIELRLVLPKEPIMGFVDREKVEKVVNNLISNGFKFTPSPGTITIGLEVHTEGDTVQIYVRDSGIGIAKEQQVRIFDRFYRAEERQNKGVLGTGIGLALTKELVKMHKGNIRVESQPGHGATFIVDLPIGKAHFDEDQFATESPQEESKEFTQKLIESYPLILKESQEHSVGNIDTTVILLVEDHADLRNYLRNSLSKNYHVLEAVHGEEGLAKAKKFVPDLIISDVMMPIMDGITFCKKVKLEEKTCHIPVILLTAKGSKESRLEGLETGADAYLTKPADQKELEIIIQNLLKNRKRITEKLNPRNPFDLSDTELNKKDQDFLQKVNVLIKENLEDTSFGVEVLRDALAMSRTQLHRKLKALTGQSTTNYIRTIRLKRALQILQEGKHNVSEVAFLTGFNSQSYFSRSFQEHYGFAPSEVKHQNEENIT